MTWYICTLRREKVLFMGILLRQRVSGHLTYRDMDKCASSHANMHTHKGSSCHTQWHGMATRSAMNYVCMRLHTNNTIKLNLYYHPTFGEDGRDYEKQLYYLINHTLLDSISWKL